MMIDLGTGNNNKINWALEDKQEMIDIIVANEGKPDVVQISGGEPTIHPNFFDILDIAKAKPIRHLMVNTNGIRISKDKEFTKCLASYMPDFEIYLQFDSFKPQVLEQLRGKDAGKLIVENISTGTSAVVDLMKN